MLDNMPPMPPIFKLIMKEGDISATEMYRTFNCGIGMCVITPKEYAHDVIDIAEKHKIKAQIVGKVVDEYGVFVRYKGRKLVLI
jgi:phosphoribosylformylglycinamidine cyclo-ligase